MAQSCTIVFTYTPNGDGRSGTLSVLSDKTLLYCDQLNPSREVAREKFCKALLERAPALDRETVDAELLRVAERAAAKPEPTPRRRTRRP